ncbi:BRCA2-interacting transcriptional repressor EMSY [Glossina fuscipes]|uniref:BRCA2-interacting transcriptional repressor EMSY n=1 Tax=Glossina fuscipes TaxID=7396 RepID=A0A8U0WMG9_9MUSC|nr:BRCA2-interacting transcriptional repressor EMSY [Glossina fuscipes]KAI9583903.1 hypothetical protein GQX74_010238 [Glossina fuscipes]
MWPQSLQMTRDECRGILRRLELESYSQVISVFRAQGGLSDAKAKLLEELRAIFHISQERHRAEARRVANDEQLATIAESISGPNTWQEWSREGRRPYPMLPRVAPKTALVLIANSIAEETMSENAKIPYPSETGEAVKEEQRESLNETLERSNFVVSGDPFKVPEIPAAHKRNLKRNISEQHAVIGSKKRAVSNNLQKSLTSPYYKHHHVTANSMQGNSTLPNSAKKASSIQNNKNLQQQRYFHQQQQIQKQKMAKKMTSNNTNPTIGKRHVTPAKSGRRVQKTVGEQHVLAKQQERQTEIQTHLDLSTPIQHELPGTPLDIQKFVGYSPQPQLPQQIFMDSKECTDSTPVLITTSGAPQTAVSKRDITTNISKLQMQQPSGSSITNIACAPYQTVTGISNTIPAGKLEKSLITPVQKYIVEDRQTASGVNNVLASSGSLVNITGIQAQSASGHLIQVSNAGVSSKVVTMPQFSAAPTKLRAASTTIITPGTKLSSTTGKKITSLSPVLSSTGNPQINAAALHELANVATSQTQVFNLIDTSPNANISPNQTVVPLHTPPAIIQLQNTSNNSAGEHIMSSHGKVLTTNILPIVLSCNTSTSSVNTIVASSALSTCGNTTLTTTTSEGGLARSFPSGVVLSTSTSNVVPVSLSNSNSVISTLSAGATVFRKAPSVIKTSMASTTPTKCNAAHIISNVKLTPVSVNTSTSTNSPFKSVVPSTTGMVRASVKICQSPNGKVFIQPANLVDGSKVSLNTSSLQHKVISAGVGHSSPTPISNAASGQRIAIQKVQIIPASLGSPAAGNNNLSPKPATLSLASGTGSPTGKSNMIIMPVSTKGAVRPVTIAKPSNNLTLKNTNHAQLPNSSHSAVESVSAVNANILVLSNTTSLKEKVSSVQSKFDSNQLLNEDAPLDILNMPIVMDSGIGSNETVTVLGTSVMNRSVATPIIVEHSLHPRNMLLGATDWEMELDHAITTAANNNNNNNNFKDQKTFNSSKSKSTISTHSCPTVTTPISSGHKQPYSCPEYPNDEMSKDKAPHVISSNIIVDDSFDDVIVEEREDEDEESQKSLQIHDNAKILGMKIFHHPSIDIADRNLTTRSVNDNKLQTSTLISSIEDQKFNTTSVEQMTSALMSMTCANVQQSSEVDAGFDETIVTEIDENTAIEYIEEDGAHMPVVSSCHSTADKGEKTTKLPALSTNDTVDNAILKISATLNNSYSHPLVLQPVAKSGTATTTKNSITSPSTTTIEKNSTVQQS